MLSLTYHPSPQNLLDRPQRPSFEQQAPHVGLQTKPSAPAQVPSTVTTPVCHGGITSVAVPCVTAHAGNSQNRANTGVFIVSARKVCEILVNRCLRHRVRDQPRIYRKIQKACLVFNLLLSCHMDISPLCYFTTLWTWKSKN